MLLGAYGLALEAMRPAVLSVYWVRNFIEKGALFRKLTKRKKELGHCDGDDP